MRTTTAAIVIRGSRILLALRKPGGAIGGKWEFPGGKARRHETAKQALARELSEELSTPATVGDRVGSVQFDNGSQRYDLEAYSVEIGEVGDTPMHVEVRWIPIAALGTYDLADSDRVLARSLGLIE